MFLFIFLLQASSRFYIKQGTGSSFLSKLNDTLILSGFYSPVEFKFSYSDLGNMNFTDAIIKKNLILSDNNIIIQNQFSTGDSSFKIIFDGESRFFLMKNNKCLEAETSMLIPKRELKVAFYDCKYKDNQLWAIFVKSNEIIKPTNIISNYYEHNKHIVYAHTLNGRTSLHGFYYHNRRNKKGKNVILYHHHKDKHSILKQKNDQKISKINTPDTDS